MSQTLEPTAYFQEVAAEQIKLLAEISKRPDQQQFRDGCLMVSVPLHRSNPNRDKAWRPGTLCLVSLGLNEPSKSRWLAACRSVDGTHELATSEQVAQYLADQARKRAELQSESRKNQLVFAAPRPAAEALKG